MGPCLVYLLLLATTAWGSSPNLADAAHQRMPPPVRRARGPGKAFKCARGTSFAHHGSPDARSTKPTDHVTERKKSERSRRLRQEVESVNWSASQFGKIMGGGESAPDILQYAKRMPSNSGRQSFRPFRGNYKWPFNPAHEVEREYASGLLENPAFQEALSALSHLRS